MFPFCSSMRAQYYRGGEGFLLVYSITNSGSLEDLKGLEQHLLVVVVVVVASTFLWIPFPR